MLNTDDYPFLSSSRCSQRFRRFCDFENQKANFYDVLPESNWRDNFIAVVDFELNKKAGPGGCENIRLFLLPERLEIGLEIVSKKKNRGRNFFLTP
jgi:hypothetical protein